MDRSLLQYYGFIITLLSSIGLWPYQNENLRRFMNPTITILLTIYLIPQFVPVVTQEFEMIVFLKNMWSIMITLGSLTKYVAFWRHAEKLKAFMEDMIHDWNTMDDEELKILKEYAYTGRRHSIIFALFMYPTMFLTVVSHFTSELLDIVAPLNETRPHVSPIVTEYFIDEQKYFFLIASYQCLMMIISGTTFIASEPIVMMLIQHLASLFVIVCHRMREAILDCIPVSGVHGRQFHPVNKYKLIKSVESHRRALKFSTDLMSTFGVSYSVFLIIGVLSESLVLFRLSQTIFLVNRMGETLQSIIMIMSMYNTDWYRTSVSTQKMLLFIMSKSFRVIDMKILIVYYPSIEGFATVRVFNLYCHAVIIFISRKSIFF
ncbi:uncharacterized protein LOC128881101 isoform X3 [Hylaeus volcanicus]|uniref:uncharacterized protein LOC128881101 isoform X3 n=1 Tax=Hylaeus volcanicus TaxID=313075 RepID=UPI0023B84ABE|nr:uncharacterized protein LOC128881101 isoform X3 [Hylaeus volcanicus]